MNEQQISLYQAIGQSLGELCEEELNAVPPRAQLHRICGSLSWTAGSAPPCGSSGQSGSAGRSGPGRYPGKGQNARLCWRRC